MIDSEGKDLAEEALEIRKGGLALAARLLLDEHDSGGAIEALRTLLKIFPDDPEINTLIANVHLSRKEFAKAKGLLDDVIKRNPGYPRALYNLGVYHSLRKDYGNAIGAYKEAIRCYPKGAVNDIADAYQNMGCAFWDSGDKMEALEAWKACLKRNPRQPQARRNLRECMNGYGLPKSPLPMMDDPMAFTHMKVNEYMESRGKGAFTSLEEANSVAARINDAWNLHIAARYGRGLDDMTIAAKKRIFRKTPVDFPK